MYENNYYTQEGCGSYGMVETVGRYTARTFLWMGILPASASCSCSTHSPISDCSSLRLRW